MTAHRRIIFDTIATERGRGYRTAEVPLVDALLDQLGIPRDGVGLAPSPRIEAFIRRYEQCRLSAYMPTPRDRPTIGWGSTGPDIRLGIIWTREQCDARFARDLADFGAGVAHLLGGAPATQGQYDAMVSLAYNVGLDDDADTVAEGLGDSTLLKKHRAGDYAGAAAEFVKWNRQKGVVLAGLTARRKEEALIYRGAAA